MCQPEYVNPLGPPAQIAYVVHDVRQAAQQWADVYGAGPFFVLDHIDVRNVLYRGKSGQFDHSSAFGQWGSIMVELLCDHGGLFGDHHGVHHVAHLVPDLAEARRWCSKSGFPEAMSATTATGMPFVFHDATATLGHYIELYEPNPRVVSLYQMVAKASEGWDGTDPIRSLSSSPIR